jgi:hypothetical protein
VHSRQEHPSFSLDEQTINKAKDLKEKLTQLTSKEKQVLIDSKSKVMKSHPVKAAS